MQVRSRGEFHHGIFVNMSGYWCDFAKNVTVLLDKSKNVGYNHSVTLGD